MANTTNQTRAVSEHHIDIGAQAGIARNIAFASGGRTHRLTPSAYTASRPIYDAPRGQFVMRGAADPAKESC